MTGFSLDEINDILGQDDLSTDVEEQELPEPSVDPVTKLGDLWILGKHRLLCGNSTNKNDVDRLMCGNKADLLFTDPPYGVSYERKTKEVFKSKNYTKIKNDEPARD